LDSTDRLEIGRYEPGISTELCQLTITVYFAYKLKKFGQFSP